MAATCLLCNGLGNNSIPPSRRKCKYAGQSVRPLPIRIMTAGKNRQKGIQLVVDEYVQKIKHFCPIDDVQIRSNPKNAREAVAQVESEDAGFINLIRPGDWVVMLDENGRDVGSEQVADLIGDAGNVTGASGLVFCVGGPYGHGRRLRERANSSIRLSSMVLNHQIALVVILEQIYRAWTIIKVHEYHH